MATDLALSIEEAAQQLAEAEAEVQRIRDRIAAIEAGGSAVEVARRERELARALLDGGDVATIEVPSMTGSQIRAAVSALRMAEAEALDKASQAKGALRRAKVKRLDELLLQALEDYDKQAGALQAAYARVCAVSERSTAMRGMSSLGAAWWRLSLPRGTQPKHASPFQDMSMLVSDGQEVAGGRVGNVARAELAAQMEREGIE